MGRDTDTNGRRGRGFGRGLTRALLVVAWLAPAGAAQALEALDFSVAGGDETLTRSLRQASLLLAQKAEGRVEAEDLFTAARADYARLLGALYAQGRYSAVIRITLDGREAADMAPLDAPARITRIAVSVDPGPEFIFSKAQVAPLHPPTELPEGFAVGQVAEAGAIEAAVSEAVLQWREGGHAKVAVERQDILVNHPNRRVAADIRLRPGPALRFGPVSVKGAERMEERRILKIAGLEEGTPYSARELTRAANRLRRSGVFASVNLVESDTLVGGDRLPIRIEVTEQKTRRYSLGAELSSIDGVGLQGYWLHRNFLGGAERLRVDASIINLGARESGADYELGLTIDRPATLTADTTAGLMAKLGHLDEIDYAADYAQFGLTFVQHMSEELTLRGGLSFEYVEGADPSGSFLHRSIALPSGATWDRRDSTSDARRGFYIDVNAKPFMGIEGTGSGLRATGDLRGYKSLAGGRVTLAARLQGGTIIGAGLIDVPRDDLFFSGGGGTVRGQPYRSLGVNAEGVVGADFDIGGLDYAAASFEVRARFGGAWGGVAFVDGGWVGADHEGASHAGAGLGLRYETGFGPLRFDLAAPISGETGEGAQIYLGLGQAF